MSNTTRMGLAGIMMSRANSETNFAFLRQNRKKKLINWRSLPVDEQHALHYEDLWGCFTRNFGKGFCIAMLAKVGLNAFWVLLSILRKRKLPSAKNAVNLLAPGSTNFAVFAGFLLSIFNSFAYLTKDTDEQSIIGHYRGAIAGAMAGTSLLVAPKSMRWTIMISILVRAVEMQLKILIKRRLIPSWLHPDSYGDVIIMGAASAVNIRYLAMNQGCFNVTYRKFLNKFGQLAPEQLQALDSMARGFTVDISKLNAALSKRDLPLLKADMGSPAVYDNLENQLVNCAVNPHSTYLQYPVRYFIGDVLQALPLYVPVYVLPLLLFAPSKIVREPITTLTRLARSVFRSATFLSAYCTVVINFVLFYRALGFRFRFIGNLASIGYALAGFTTGFFTTLIEKKSRRIELALYVLSQAVESLCNAIAGVHTYRPGEIVVGAVKATAFKASSNTSVGVLLSFMASMAVVGHAYMRHPDVIRGVYLGILRRFFDSDERHVFMRTPQKKKHKLHQERDVLEN